MGLEVLEPSPTSCFLFCSPRSYLLLSLYLPAVLDYVLLEENKPFLPQVPFVGLFDLSHEKVIEAAAVYSHVLHFLSFFPCNPLQFGLFLPPVRQASYRITPTFPDTPRDSRYLTFQ